MTRTTLQRLLRYPHSAVFDTSPQAELAFRLRHPDGATWSIAERVFTASAGAIQVTYDLRSLTVGALVTQLSAAGFTVEAASPRFTGLSAVVLVEGSGDQGQSNGDHIMGFTSLLWVLLSGVNAGRIDTAPLALPAPEEAEDTAGELPAATEPRTTWQRGEAAGAVWRTADEAAAGAPGATRMPSGQEAPIFRDEAAPAARDEPAGQ